MVTSSLFLFSCMTFEETNDLNANLFRWHSWRTCFMWWCLIITTIPSRMLVIYRLPFIHKQHRFTWYTDFLQNGITWFPGYTICPHQHQIQMRYNWVKIKITFITDIPFHLLFNYTNFAGNRIKICILSTM